MIAVYRIFNESSGRYLAALNDDYLTFYSRLQAKAYLAEKNLSPEVFRIERVWRWECDD